MAQHEKFNFNSLEEVENKITELGIDLACSRDLSILKQPVKIGPRTAPNAFAVLPMEGCDALPSGGPSELLRDRYLRFCAGGAGLVWWEACAVVPEGRANELQMMLTEENVADFAALLKECDAAAIEKNGVKPVHILQLTHSGRYSRPVGHTPAPIVPQRDPILDARSGVKDDSAVCTDEYLESLPARYVHSALLAKEAGFDGVDIKACHRYLMSELLASHTRKGKYGGSFENRTRLLLDTVRAVREAVGPDFIVASRFNVFDAHPYPYGFGQLPDGDVWGFDESEPIRLTKLLCEAGVDLLSNSAGNPYYIYPQVTRPFDTSSQGIPTPEEHPLESVRRLFWLTSLVQQAAGDVPVIGNGYTWLRQFAPYFGAANLQAGTARMLGFGRGSIAYPDAPHDVIFGDAMQPNKCCVACSRCTQIMRDHGRTGCVIRNAKIYGPLYQQYRAEADARAAAAAK